MDLKIPLVIDYLPLNYRNKCRKIDVIVDKNDDNDIYISFTCNRNHVLRTLIVKSNSTINIKYNEWKGSYDYHLSPELFAYISNNKLIITNGKSVVGEIRASKIMKYIFNPHERIGAIVFTNTGIFKKKNYVIIGFNDGSYSILESSLLDIVPYANGFIVAYKDGKQVVLEKIPYGVESRYDIETNSLALHNCNGLISITYDDGSLIIDGKNMEILSNTSLRNGVPLGVANDTIVLWNPKSYAVYIKNYIDSTSKEKIALICKSRPILAGTIEDKILLSCSNNIIEVKDNNWRLHEISKKILGKQLVSALIIGGALVVGTPDKVIVWSAEKYYFYVMNLLGITKSFNKHLIVIDENNIGVVDINKYIERANIVSNSKSQFDGNLRLKKRIEFNKNIIIQKIVSNGNRIIKKRQNSFDIIFIKNKPVIFDIVYYGKYEVKRDDSNTISNSLKILSAEIMNYKTSNSIGILNIEYVYTNPLDRDVFKPIKINGQEIGRIRLRKRSKGKSLLQIPVNNVGNHNHIMIEDIIIPTNKYVVQKTQYSINNISIDLINGKIILLINISASGFIDRNERMYVCVRGFFNGCKKLKLINNVNANISVPVTINYSKDYIDILLYGLLELPHKVEAIKYDRKTITVDSNTISLVTTSHKNKLYVIVDDLPSTDKDVIILINEYTGKYKIKKLPFLLSYKPDRPLRKKVKAVILQLDRGTIYYNRSSY